MSHSLERTDGRLAARFMTPSIVLVCAVALAPIVSCIWLSFHRRMPIFGIDAWVGLSNYAELLSDERFFRALGTTTTFAVVSVSLELVLGLLFALAVHRAFRGRGLTRAAILIPWAIPTVVSARMFEWMFHPDMGIVNYVLGIQGTSWLGTPGLALAAAIAADVWKTTPFAALLLLAGLQAIPDDLYRAARIDGASAWQAFRHVTLPLLKPAILVVVLFRTLDAFRVFDVIFVLTGGGPAGTTETLSIYSYRLLFQTLQFGYGSTVAVATFVFVLLLSLLYIRLIGRMTPR